MNWSLDFSRPVFYIAGSVDKKEIGYKTSSALLGDTATATIINESGNDRGEVGDGDGERGEEVGVGVGERGGEGEGKGKVKGQGQEKEKERKK